MEEKNVETIMHVLGILIFIVALVFLFYDDVDNSETDEMLLEDKFFDEFWGTNELHWDNMPITYSYGENCVGPIIPRIEWAFDIIENETEGLISFEEVDLYGDINFVCYSSNSVGDSFIDLGLTSTDILGSTIESAEIEFWSVAETIRPTSCYFFPSLEMHEILHGFGFDHADEIEIYSIMYAYDMGCVARDDIITRNGKTYKPEDKIDDEIVSCLKYIYSNGEELGTCDGIPFL